MTELCARSGSSRKTGYKWLARFADAGLAGLLDYNRAPLSCPHRIVPDVLAVVRAACEQHPPGAALVTLSSFMPSDTPTPKCD